jgi:hypothetical protein
MKPESKDYRSSSINKEMNKLFQTCFKAFEDELTVPDTKAVKHRTGFKILIS